MLYLSIFSFCILFVQGGVEQLAKTVVLAVFFDARCLLATIVGGNVADGGLVVGLVLSLADKQPVAPKSSFRQWHRALRWTVTLGLYFIAYF